MTSQIRNHLICGTLPEKVITREDAMGTRPPALRLLMLPGEEGWTATHTLFRPRRQSIRMALSNGSTVTFKVSDETAATHDRA